MSIWIEQMPFLLARKDNIFCKDIQHMFKKQIPFICQYL